MPFSKASRSIIRPNPEFEPGTLQEWGPPYTSRIQSASVPGSSIVVYVRKCVEWVLSAGVQHSNLHPGTAWDLVDRGQGLLVTLIAMSFSLLTPAPQGCGKD